jgi:predicted ester cyclase
MSRETNEGEFHGSAPTDKKMEARGVQVARFEEGRMVERWGSSDEAGLMRQLGLDS